MTNKTNDPETTPNVALSRAPELALALFSPFWLIAARHLAAARQRLLYALSSDPGAFFDLEDVVVARPPLRLDRAGNAHISISGVLADKMPPIWQKLGFTDYRSIRSELAEAREAGATSITLDIDSPGGSVAGLTEAADAIMAESDAGTPVEARCDGMACSAAYWLAAAADHITASPSTSVGNIGVILTFADYSRFLEGVGVEIESLTNQGADLKSTFHGAGGITDAQRAFLQTEIDGLGADFRAHVTGQRPGISPEVFRAGWYSGRQAVDLGLTDTLTTSEDSP